MWSFSQTQSEYCRRQRFPGGTVLTGLTHSSLFLEQLLQLSLFAGQLQLQVLTPRQKPFIVLQVRWKKSQERCEQRLEGI